MLSSQVEVKIAQAFQSYKARNLMDIINDTIYRCNKYKYNNLIE